MTVLRPVLVLVLVLAGCGTPTTQAPIAFDSSEPTVAEPPAYSSRLATPSQSVVPPGHSEVEVTITASPDVLPMSTPTESSGATYGDEGGWTDATGDPAPPRAIVRVDGPEHCGWEEATFLEIEWGTLGLDVPQASGPYVDDLSEILMDVPPPQPTVAPPAEAAADSLTLERMPDEAIDTGYTDDGVRLWAAPDGSAIWLEFDDRVEQWPELLIGCA